MILITHNILWSKYKGVVFSKLNELAIDSDVKIHFLQIAETENDRVSLTGIDLSYHQYPYKLMFSGSHGDVPKWLVIKDLFIEIWRTKADVVVLAGFHLVEYWFMLLAARLKGKTVGVFCDSTAHDRPHSVFKGLLKKLFFSQCVAFFVYGQRSREYLMSFGVPNDSIYRRCQAAALPHSYSITNALQQRIAFAPSIDAPRFLYVGRLSPEKSLDVLLNAFVQVRHVLPAAILVLVGSGPQHLKLEELSRSLGLVDAVFFAGSMDAAALATEYAKASCLVLPSFSEPWGLVVNEALSYGCPVVVSHRCGCVPELVENKSTGFVFEAKNVDDLANKLSAVPTTFVNVEVTARSCLDLISTFNPKAAAEEILRGCKLMLASNRCP